MFHDCGLGLLAVSGESGKICVSRCESFHPFVASADGMLASAATQLLQHLAGLLVDHQQNPYSTVMQHPLLHLAITLVKAVHRCLQGSRKKRLLHTPGFLVSTQLPNVVGLITPASLF